MSKTLVLYVFHIYNQRVAKFIKNCIFYKDNIDFIVISNGDNTYLDLPDYVKFFKRENIGFDFGGWSDALLTNDLYKNYNKFIFVNSSVSGPFLPSYYKGKWTDVYLEELKYNNIKLFGSTINTMENPRNKAHVQSYIFSLEKEALEYLIEKKIFTKEKYVETLTEAIETREIAMSRLIIENNWNIGCLLPIYKNIDFTFKNSTPQEYNIPYEEDLMYEHFRNILWSEYQLVFIKGNRMSNIKLIK